ncbi:MAG: Rieske 2Fe-2S domain-containing protein [Deltaproteobacteria bacterium]|nr:Rieske 2Fe-2S domain-containing protein [Deltaproteobacteria bacterium]
MAGGPEPGMIRACTLERLDAVGLVRLRLMGRPVGILRTSAGAPVARELSCKHQGADLSTGDRVGCIITCSRHGWRYDLATGECLLPTGAPPLREHAVAVQDGAVWISLLPCDAEEPTG